MKPVLVGETNPYGADPYFALYPEPAGCAGWRLCHAILGLQRGRYLRSFERVNLCDGPWRAAAARARAEAIARAYLPRAPLILLGVKVAEAFRVATHPFTVHGYGDDLVGKLVLLPHPSGRCRVWNEHQAVERARALVLPLLEA